MGEHLHSKEDPRIFVFGSNLKGIHGAGAAKYAHDALDAVWGCPHGRQGGSYAIPTCSSPGRPLPLGDIRVHVLKFLDTARQTPNTRYFVSEIGCGLAGYDADEIGPMFAGSPSNVDLPPGWRDYVWIVIGSVLNDDQEWVTTFEGVCGTPELAGFNGAEYLSIQDGVPDGYVPDLINAATDLDDAGFLSEDEMRQVRIICKRIQRC